MDLQTILQLLKSQGPATATQGAPPQPQGNFSMGPPPGGGAGAMQGLPPPTPFPQQPDWFKNTPYNPATQNAPSAAQMGIVPDQ